MGPRFKVFFALFFLAAAPFVLSAEAPDTQQNSEALEMIAQRMRSLTNSLEGMPQPPKFDQKIQLPGAFLPRPKPSASAEEDVF